jgi:hypothetical protein
MILLMNLYEFIVPVLNQAPHHDDVLRGGTIAPCILELGTPRSEWSASRPGRFTTGTHCIGGCVANRAGLDAVVKKKAPAAAGNLTPVVQPVA